MNYYLNSILYSLLLLFHSMQSHIRDPTPNTIAIKSGKVISKSRPPNSTDAFVLLSAYV